MLRHPGIARFLVAPACFVFAGVASGADAPVTFTEHVAPIVFQSCSPCHRPGEAAPFSLLSYRDVTRRGSLIRQVVDEGAMPPWPPAAGWGHFQDERRLAPEQVKTIDRWVEAGMPEGPADRLPALPKFPEGGWALGTPDLVVTLPEPFEVPADGPDIYRMFVLPLNLNAEKWVTAVEIRPTARSVVHHAIYFLDETGGARRLDEQDPGLGFSRMGFPRTGTLGGWAVGATPRHLPMGLAYRLPKGADLVVQVHFHPSGKPEREQTKLGLHFAPERPKKALLGMQAPPAFGLATELRTRGIKPGEADFTIQGRWVAPFDVDVVSVGGHAHYLCKTMKAVATLPDGRSLNLFAIDDWDFNWQGRYNYARPVRLPKGTVVATTLTYDNSAGNPRNPSSPPVHVRWGEGSTDEMGSIGLGFVAVNEADAATYRRQGGLGGGLRGLLGGGAAGGAGLDAAALRARFKALDADGNGRLTGDEVPERLRPFSDRIDTDGDGALDAEELRRALEPFLRGAGGAGVPAESPTPTPTPAPAPPAPARDRGPALSDLDGRAWHPLDPEPGSKGNALIFVAHDCPVANGFAPEIRRIALDYGSRGIQCLLVQVDPDLTDEAARAHARDYGLDLPVLVDRKHELIDRVGPRVTPEAAVVKPGGAVTYQGRIDDRFGKLGRQRPEPSKRDLREALDALLAGLATPRARVDAIGCPIARLP